MKTKEILFVTCALTCIACAIAYMINLVPTYITAPLMAISMITVSLKSD